VAARSAGFSLVELTVALALTLMVAAAVAAIVDPARGAFVSQPEAADVQQRLRVGVDALTRDLIGAGAGLPVGAQRGPLVDVIPPLLPFRRGAIRNDPPDTCRTDTITAIGIPATAAQTTLAADLAPGGDTFTLTPPAGCPDGVNLCGFAPGMTVLVFDAGGAFDLFVVATVDEAASQLSAAPGGAAYAYRTGASVVEARVRTYTVKDDPVSRSSQLVQSDGTANADVPVLDHVAGLTFGYAAASDAVIDASELADGPWLPDGAAPWRWDADLRRIRTVRVTLRVEAALAALRGPAGALFHNRGVATSAQAWVPDQEVRFVVSPRNLSETR
jgi:hypothetical protein